MSNLKIFSKNLEDIEILEYNLNKFIQSVNLISIKTNIATNRYGESVIVCFVIYKEKSS